MDPGLIPKDLMRMASLMMIDYFIFAGYINVLSVGVVVDASVIMASSTASTTPNTFDERRFEIYQDFWRLYAETRARVTIMRKEREKASDVEFIDHRFEPQGGFLRWTQDRYSPPSF